MFLQDDTLQLAIVMLLILIGESVNRLSEEFRVKHVDMPWMKIVGLRNVAAHGYWRLDMEQIWQTVEEDIPILIAFFENPE